MANIIAEAIGGFIGGLVAGLIGYVTDLTLGAVFQAFGTLSSWFIVLGIIYAVISFIMGLAVFRGCSDYSGRLYFNRWISC
jgi:hypothetical protein